MSSKPFFLHFLFLITFVLGFFSAKILLAQAAEGFVAFKHGDLEITALSGSVGKTAYSILKGASGEELDKMSADAGVPAGGFPSWINVFAVKKDGKLFLIDTGVGGAGSDLVPNLAKAGLSPEAADYVLITHFHGDHVGGLVDSEGKAAFPNATLIVPKADVDYFIPETGSVSGTELAKKAIAPYRESGKYLAFEGDEIPVPGLAPVKLYGHTPGHTGFEFEGSAGPFLAWGDITHVQPVQFRRPDVTVTYDVDPAAAAATRIALFGRLTADPAKTTLVSGAHLPFPGIGRVEKDGDAYKWVPREK
ncbi:MAG: MBL fold metallo-hydrolase [Deltaproteobacteria bacterium]|jgi:glyoxylase-like metal-dependent hydrolase (beta-lactamase superfamily II)|nr:MBL fold metallo-hydrolase [Deltaproteobacteria bacterium]